MKKDKKEANIKAFFAKLSPEAKKKAIEFAKGVAQATADSLNKLKE